MLMRGSDLVLCVPAVRPTMVASVHSEGSRTYLDAVTREGISDDIGLHLSNEPLQADRHDADLLSTDRVDEVWGMRSKMALRNHSGRVESSLPLCLLAFNSCCCC